MLNDLTILALAVALVNYASALGVTIHAVLWKRDSRAVIGWVGLAWLAPLVGVFAYLCLGVNRIERKALFLHVRRAYPVAPNAEDRRQREALLEKGSSLIGLAAVGRHITGTPVLPGNAVQPLINGDQAYPAMIEAIQQAKHSVALLSYIFDSDQAGDLFFDALVAAHHRGVQVRVLVDDVGSRYSRPNMVGRLKKAGLHATTFLPTYIPRLPKYANLRNHRKILVVDGKIGFTGGTNIRDGHWLSAQPSHPVECLHFRVEGPVVEHLQQVFSMDWAFATEDQLTGELWFPDLQRAGDVWARGIADGPDEDFENLSNLLAGALASATRQVRIVTPYFLPNSGLIQALNVAAMRGIDVEIYIPSRTNIRLVQWACNSQLWQILEKGCRVFHTAPPFDHTKLMVVDDSWVLIGSTNWDDRSLRLNFEFNVECYNTDLALEVNKLIDGKAEKAHQVTLEEINQRKFAERLRDGLARLFSPYL